MSSEPGDALFSSLPDQPKIIPTTEVGRDFVMADGPMSLLLLAEYLRTGKIKPPLHQRETDAWPTAKKRDWINRCAQVMAGTARPPLGCVCLYRLRGEPSQIYLNEGLQRISAALEALISPIAFGYAEANIRNILEVNQIHVQHRFYGTHSEAVPDFIAVNNGVGLEPTEVHRHVLCYADGYDGIWKKQLSFFSEKLHETLAPYCNFTDRRRAKLSAFRSDLQLFCVAHLGGPTEFGRDDKLERMTVDAFKQSSPDVVKAIIKFYQDHSAEISTAWRKKYPDTRMMMQAALAKWCLGVRMLHNNEASIDWWQTFFTRLFDKTVGHASIIHVHPDTKKPHHYNLTTKFSSFSKVCKLLELNVPDKMRRAKNAGPALAPGFQYHHSLPFADHGDGPTEPLAGRLNAAKNART